jgi:hypothetical protein
MFLILNNGFIDAKMFVPQAPDCRLNNTAPGAGNTFTVFVAIRYAPARHFLYPVCPLKLFPTYKGNK